LCAGISGVGFPFVTTNVLFVLFAKKNKIKSFSLVFADRSHLLHFWFALDFFVIYLLNSFEW